jgi:hypothetical protein
METEEQELSNEDSLRIISEMVQAAKTGISDNGFFYLLWGWLVFTSSLSQYVLLVLVRSEYNGVPWMILMPLGGVLTMWYKARQKKIKRVKTFLDEFMKYAVWAFLVSLFIVLFSIYQTGNPQFVYPMIMMVYGAWLFLSGGVLRFKPLVIGGIINWALAVTSMFVVFQWQLLLLALAVLLGYIIPGHLLKANHKNE